MGPGTATTVSWKTGEDMGKRILKIDKKQRKNRFKKLFNTHIIFGKLLHIIINCQQKWAVEITFTCCADATASISSG